MKNRTRIEKPAIAVWSILKPCEAVSLTRPYDDPGTPQDCVMVNYMVTGDTPGDRGQRDGLWTIELGDQALGRVLQRPPDADLSTTIMQAHHALLRANGRALFQSFADGVTRFYVLAGDGGFCLHHPWPRGCFARARHVSVDPRENMAAPRSAA